MKFGNLVKLKRTNKNITLTDLEGKTKISSSYISRIENDLNKTPSAETVFKLSKALDISIQDLQDCFEVKLNESDENSTLKLIEETDYVLIKQAEELMVRIANNKEEYYNAINKLLNITNRLRKTQVRVICSVKHDDKNVDYVVNIRIYENHIVEAVKDMLKSRFKNGRIKVVEGRFLENSEAYYYDLNEFIESMQELDCVNEFEIEELLNYLKKINY
ncbi:helix-turn-helix domain-containing protein [Clostridium sp. P21]|uniref:Helix-turn-helix domain-containing protein n=1 Tax=Clostridium muellerianum TaxID=2716538 RepID=A0A7Y0EIR3_9CLOT|nr:helix-turn-helix domain-containing protein [Clostridium muellerianum]NMM64226.1 helix-turn-helix domain-containing protein [Clostridium muellerianum]